jgi:HlyD family secretion protein
MSGDVDIIVEKKENALRLPISAVNIISDKSGSVIVKENTSTKPINITTGLESDDFIEIVAGLKEGQEVLINGTMGYQQNMQSGMMSQGVTVQAAG